MEMEAYLSGLSSGRRDEFFLNRAHAHFIRDPKRRAEYAGEEIKQIDPPGCEQLRN